MPSAGCTWSRSSSIGRAEVEYNQSPTNLLTHLNTQYPGHQDAYEDCKKRKGGKKSDSGAGGSASGSTLTGQAAIGKYFGVDTTSWQQELVRWMVMHAIPFSVRTCAVYLVVSHAS